MNDPVIITIITKTLEFLVRSVAAQEPDYFTIFKTNVIEHGFDGVKIAINRFKAMRDIDTNESLLEYIESKLQRIIHKPLIDPLK